MSRSTRPDRISGVWYSPASENRIRSLGIEKVEDAWREDLPGEIVNDRGDRQVLRLDPPDGSAAVYLKRWRLPHGSILRWIPGKREMRNRARNEFENLLTLSEGGVLVPMPLALGEAHGVGGPTASFLLVEELTGLREAAGVHPRSDEELGALVQGAARTLSRLHRLGLYWRSPGLKHFFVDEALETFALIDVPRLEKGVSPLRRALLGAFGGDPPCRERDLSKLLAELLERHSDREVWVNRFWEGCGEVFPEESENAGWRSQVLRQAVKRRATRSRG